MDEEIITTEENKKDEYLEALESIPPEVRRFMWSDAFTLILKAIGEAYKLNDSQKETLRQVVMGILTDTTTPIATRAKLSDVGISGELQENILNEINEEIISRVLVQIQEYKDYDELTKEVSEGDKVPTPEGPTVSPVQALDNIKQALSQPTSIAPTKRDYSLEKLDTTIKQAPSEPRPKTMDIYRELPEQ
jgi:phage FluMu gp28-like protein